MPVITHIARHLFSYPFMLKVWEKATTKEAKLFWTNQRPPYSKKSSNTTRST